MLTDCPENILYEQKRKVALKTFLGHKSRKGSHRKWLPTIKQHSASCYNPALPNLQNEEEGKHIFFFIKKKVCNSKKQRHDPKKKNRTNFPA
jgi:hypothetical protein